MKWQVSISPFLKVALLACSVISILCIGSYFDPEDKYFHLFYNSAFVGGFLSGSLHALTGADHMTAVLPLIFGKRWWQGSWQGMIWGIGHGMTSAIIGLLSYTMKSFVISTESFLTLYAYIIDILVGLTLLVIGAMGLWEAEINIFHWCCCSVKDNDVSTNILHRAAPIAESITSEEIENDLENNTTEQTVPNIQKSALTTVSVIVNGAVLGLSWDGLPSLAPAVVLEATPLACFLFSYMLGTVLMMAFAAGLVGEATCWISHVTKVNIAERLAAMSSLAALAIGLLWVLSGLVKYLHQIGFNLLGEETVADFLNINDGSYLAAISNNDGTLNNDNFRQASTVHRTFEIVISTGSIISVAAVIWMATYCEFGSSALSLQHFRIQRNHIHQI